MEVNQEVLLWVVVPRETEAIGMWVGMDMSERMNKHMNEGQKWEHRSMRYVEEVAWDGYEQNSIQRFE